MATNVTLPEGFVVDNNSSELPSGFVIDSDGSSQIEAERDPATPMPQDEDPQQAKQVATPYSDIAKNKAEQYSYQTKPNDKFTQDKSSLGGAITGGAEVAANLLSGAISTPIAGIAGLGELASGGDLKSATDTIESTQEALTYQPKTESGIEYQQALGEAIQPVGEVIESTGEWLGDATRDATGSWVLGGLAQSIPEAVLELVGVKGAGRIVKPKNILEPKPKAALSQSAPEIKQLRQAASKLYKEIDDAGVRVPKSDYLNLGIKINNVARQSGFDPNLTPKVKGFLDRLESDYKKGQIKLSDIDQLRKVAQIPANAIDNATESAIGSKIISTIDDFLDSQGEKLASSGGQNLGGKYRDARNLISRVKKAEVIDEAVFKASEAASGFENGLRNEIRSILKNKKKRRGFTPDEVKAMQQITQGGSMENMFKKLGKLGFGADQQTNMLLGSLGFAGGMLAGGPLVAAAVPTVGYVSAKIAKKLGERNVRFLNDITKAGKNGEELVKAYIKNVPKVAQRPEELSALLSDPSIDATDISEIGKRYRSSKKLIDDAAFMTRKLRQAQLAGALSAQIPDEGEQE
ncbi:hypothetical protein CTH30272_02095 [Allocatenococcus thiocycli]|nr:hypothetical protein CTH30272_02095 [Catenococcus thiocycli]